MRGFVFSLVGFFCSVIAVFWCRDCAALQSDQSQLNAPSVSLANCSVFVVSVAWREQHFRHVRELLSTGPISWAKIERVSCPVCGGVKCESQVDAERSVTCAHAKAYRRALENDAPCAFIVEDDVQLAPNFWAELRLRWVHVFEARKAGVLWLEYLAFQSDAFSRLWSEGEHVRLSANGAGIAKKFSPSPLWPMGHVWGAAAYIMSRQALNDALAFVENAADSHIVSEQAIRAAAEKNGGFLSTPPIAWQCSKARDLRDSVQDMRKHMMDQAARTEQKRKFERILSVKIADWLTEECV